MKAGVVGSKGTAKRKINWSTYLKSLLLGRRWWKKSTVVHIKNM